MPASKDRTKPATGEDRWVCPVRGCSKHYKRCDDLGKAHFKKDHPQLTWDIKLPVAAHSLDIKNNPAYATSLGSLTDPSFVPPVTAEASESSVDTVSIAQNIAKMDLAGRGQREKKPTEKVKDTTAKKEEPVSGQLVPPKYKLPDPDPKWFEKPKEIVKIFHHTKINEKTGEKFDFYKLGPQ